MEEFLAPKKQLSISPKQQRKTAKEGSTPSFITMLNDNEEYQRQLKKYNKAREKSKKDILNRIMANKEKKEVRGKSLSQLGVTPGVIQLTMEKKMSPHTIMQVAFKETEKKVKNKIA